MGRPKGSYKTPSYRLHKSSGQGVVTIAGRAVYCGPYKSPESIKKYERVIGEYLARGRIEVPTLHDGGGATITQIIARYLQEQRDEGASKAAIGSVRRPFKVLKEHFGETDAAKFGPLALKAYRQEVMKLDVIRYAGPQRGVISMGRKLCVRTINVYIEKVHMLLGWAASNELIPMANISALHTVKPLNARTPGVRPSRIVQPADPVMVSELLRFLPPNLRAMVQLHMLSGFRSTELCLMRGVDIDMSGPTWFYTPTEHKTQNKGKDRTIPLGPQSQEILRPWLRQDVTAFIFSPQDTAAWYLEEAALRSKHKTNLIYQRAARRKLGVKVRRAGGDRFTCWSYYAAVRTGVKKYNRWRSTIGLPPIHLHPHQLRHTCATEIADRFDLQASADVLGHSSVATTKTYAKVKREKLGRIMAEVG